MRIRWPLFFLQGPDLRVLSGIWRSRQWTGADICKSRAMPPIRHGVRSVVRTFPLPPFAKCAKDGVAPIKTNTLWRRLCRGPFLEKREKWGTPFPSLLTRKNKRIIIYAPVMMATRPQSNPKSTKNRKTWAMAGDAGALPSGHPL